MGCKCRLQERKVAKYMNLILLIYKRFSLKGKKKVQVGKERSKIYVKKKLNFIVNSLYLVNKSYCLKIFLKFSAYNLNSHTYVCLSIRNKLIFKKNVGLICIVYK